MKKLILAFISLFAGFVMASGQTQQGNFLLGGGLGASFGNKQTETPGPNNTIIVRKERSTGVTFNPKIAFFIVNGFALGLDADIRNLSYRDKDNDVKSTSSYFTLGPSVRYYFPVNVFLDGRVGFGSGKGGAYVGYNEARVLSYSFGAGYAAFLNDYIALEPIIRYRAARYANKSDTDFVTTDGNLEFALGLQIYL